MKFVKGDVMADDKPEGLQKCLPLQACGGPVAQMPDRPIFIAAHAID
jgi:hypothetical protein